MIDRIRKPVEADFLKYRQLMVSSFSSDNEILSSVSAYLSESQGKQFRPVFLLLSAAIAGGVRQSSVTMAVALELLHTASLLHDDVVDVSDQRRSRPTVNAVWNNKTAILSGDYFLSKVIGLVASTFSPALMQGLAQTGQSLADGELLQLSHAGSLTTNEQTYFEIIQKKTASLFAYSAYAGAVTAGADENTASVLRQFGMCLGYIFQMRDDVFDFLESGQIGKPAGADLREGKLTLPLIYALNSKDYSAPLKELLRDFSNLSTQQLQDISRLTFASGGVTYANDKMSEIKTKALSLLESFPESEFRSSLAMCLDYAMNRQR